jgi:bifunctional NMN adenylyltransferase/nudix hydrolase
MNTETRQDLAVYIGRFQPFHNGHLALLKQALNTAAHVIVVIGSAHQARTPKNPFTWSERCEMIKLALTDAERSRISYLPVRDCYDEERWVQAVRRGVEQIGTARGLPAKPSTTLVGHFKDATSDYLRRFEGWQLCSVERASPVDAAHIREALFGTQFGTPFGSVGHALEASLAALSTVAPPSTLDFLRAWVSLPFFAALHKEWLALRRYQEAWSSAPYPPVFVTVDTVVRCAGKVLLIKRGQAPGVGLYAVPGGFIEQRETAYQSALRELREETRLSLLETTMRAALKGSAVFDHPDRSLRGRTITHAFYFDLGERPLPEITAADDAQAAAWTPIGQITALEDQFHDDHFHMLDHFLDLQPGPVGASRIVPASN